MRRSRRIFVIVPFVTIAALVWFSPAPVSRTAQTVFTTAAWPFLKFGSLIHHKGRSVIAFLTDQRLLLMQNASLEKRLEQSSTDQTTIRELRAENARLKRVLEFRQSSQRDVIAANVIGYDPSGWTQSLIIDKGTPQGIAVNQAVVCPEGVVGKIAQAGPVASKVLLIVDRHIRLGAMLENSRDVGILEGFGPRRCRVLYLPKETVIELGQRVLTSGLGGIFPKGLLIGKVIAVSLDELGLYQVAEVEPAVSISKLEEVLVLHS